MWQGVWRWVWLPLGSGKFLGGQVGGGGELSLQVPLLRRRFPPTLLLRKRPDRSSSALGAASLSRVSKGGLGRGGAAGRGRCIGYPASAWGRPRTRARAPCGRRPGAAPAFPSCACGATSSPRRQRCRGRGLAAAEARDAAAPDAARGAGCGARGRREREARGGGSAAGWPRRQACSAERPLEPRQEVSEWRASPGAHSRRLAPWPPSLPASLLGPGFAPRDYVPGPGNTAGLLHPSLGVGSGRTPHLPTPEPSPPGRPAPLGSIPRRRGACEDSLLLRRPVWSDAGPVFLFLVWSRASASEVKSVRPQSRIGASPAGVMGTRAEEGLAAPLTSPPLPPHPGALGPPREPTLAAVASWQVTRSWAPGP